MSHDDMCLVGYMPPDLLTTMCICPTLRHVRHAEYERGREDAAKAVEAAEAWYDPREINPDGTVTNYMEQAVAIAAARGEGAA